MLMVSHEQRATSKPCVTCNPIQGPTTIHVSTSVDLELFAPVIKVEGPVAMTSGGYWVLCCNYFHNTLELPKTKTTYSFGAFRIHAFTSCSVKEVVTSWARITTMERRREIDWHNTSVSSSPYFVGSLSTVNGQTAMFLQRFKRIV
jgi:hypothetical protein